jgi:hypothetical protein
VEAFGPFGADAPSLVKKRASKRIAASARFTPDRCGAVSSEVTEQTNQYQSIANTIVQLFLFRSFVLINRWVRAGISRFFAPGCAARRDEADLRGPIGLNL